MAAILQATLAFSCMKSFRRQAIIPTNNGLVLRRYVYVTQTHVVVNDTPPCTYHNVPEPGRYRPDATTQRTRDVKITSLLRQKRRRDVVLT